MSGDISKCIQCERTNDEVPLIELTYKEAKYWICPQHLPIVIHKPHMLVGKLPGAEHLEFEGH